MKITLRLIGVLGLLIFGLLISVTFLSPGAVEESAKGFVKHQIETEIRARQQAVVDSDMAAQALVIAQGLGLESEVIQRSLDRNLPQVIAGVVASMCGYDCAKSRALAESITSGYLERLERIEVAEHTLGDIIKAKYVDIVAALKFDLRVFLGSNLFMFLALLLVSYAKPQALVHLFVPAVLLFASTIAASAIYVFGQDWFYAILYNDYMGFGYLAYLSLIFGVLMDIAVNKARVTSSAINGVANALGSALSVVPC